MKNLLKKAKFIIKNSRFLNYIARRLYSLLPVGVKERISTESNYAYSSVENKNKIIFVHIPKCAGNSVMETLFEAKGQGHSRLQDYFDEDQWRFQEYFKFSIIRDPVNRFLSAFNYLKQGGMGTYDIEFSEQVLGKYQSVEELCAAMKKDPYFEERILNWTHFIPQTEFLTVNGEIQLDLIMKLENIEEDFEKLKTYLGRQDIGELKVVNKNSIRNETIPEETAKYLEILYSADVSLYERV